jgi:hypothetical protein
MKKIFIPFCLSFLALVNATAQTFSDDFESYAVSTHLGPQSPDWTTWSGTQGGADDILVSNTDAHSGTNSIYFSTTAANGGPADIILPFGGTHSQGAFTFTSWFKMLPGKGGYFNFQGTSTMGGLFTLNTFFSSTGILSITNTKEQVLSTNYTQGVWFKLELVADLNTNSWELFIDNVSKGKFQCADYTIYAIDYYATSPTDAFYVDDVSYAYTPFSNPTVNGAVGYLNILNGLVTQQRDPSVTVRNLGVNAINSFTLNMTANGIPTSQNYTGLNIASGAAYTAILTNPVTLIAGLNTFTATITNVNGAGTDAYPADDSKTISFTPVQAGKDKIVVAEEGTGTWCGWCPRGAVALDNMTKNFEGFFQGIAVHNGDPMVFATYDTGLGTKISGYPSALVDRLDDIDPSNINADFMKRIVLTPVAALKNGAIFNSTTGDLSVSVKTTFATAASGNYRVACVLVEDSVRSTAAGYSQSNYYAGGANGVMGGYESKPNPVPASQMIYDHVARAIAPSFEGLANAYPATVNAGEVYNHAFLFNISTWNKNKLHIVSMIIAPDGKIENAGVASYAEALANGYSIPTGVKTVVSKPAFATVYPNPSKGLVNLQLNTFASANVELQVIDLSGAVILKSQQNIVAGTTIIPMETDKFVKGSYIVLVTMNGDTQAVPFVLN